MDLAGYTVTANRLNLRAEPGIDSRVISVLSRGTAVVLHAEATPAWWQVHVHEGTLQGFVARRYLAPLSSGSPVVPADVESLLWTTTAKAIGRVRYQLGAKHSVQGSIDCSGWVGELTRAAFAATNAAAAPEVVFERADIAALDTHSDGIVSGVERRTGAILTGAQLAPETLRPGMLIGCDFGNHRWELGSPRRVYGIDHIVQVIRDPVGGGLWISQSSSSGGGVNRIPLADWLGAAAQAKLRTEGRMRAVDPFLMADRNTRFVGMAGAVRAVATPRPPSLSPVDLPAAPAGPPIPVVSAAAFALIVEFEVTGRAHYEKKLVHPIWPQLKSGVTIGVGHDLGYTTHEDFDRNWTALAAADRERLRRTVGLTGHAARDCLSDVRHIVVPWELAEAVYRNVDIPRTAAATARILPNCDKLSGDCFGVLVSVGFNRGLSYRKTRQDGGAIDRYREMRAIYALMEQQQFDLIPAQIRAMKRIWRGTQSEAGLSRRRDAEADLFAQGLRIAAEVAVVPQPEETGDVDALHPETVAAPPSDEEFVDIDEDLAADRARAPLDEAPDAQADLVARSQVVWANDDRAVDYAHLRGLLPQGTRFSLRAEDLERLWVLNSFPDDGFAGLVLFGLRGCGIISGGEAFTSEVILIDRRPDHCSARCVMGVWDRATQQIAVFAGSTVPNAKAVAGWQRTRKSGNLLPSGFYRYISGTHNGKPGCFVLRKSANRFRTVVVRRSSNDLRYERTDAFEVCAPGDNIHPTFFQTPDDFSSFGCQVVVGSANTAGQHTGPWSRFRVAAGLTARGARDGQEFGYMLLTGAEASLASALRRDGKDGRAPEWASLRRLRFGSNGEEVVRLQTQLGLPDPDGDFGPNTANGLHNRQRQLLEGRSDGICSPEFTRLAGWTIF